MDIVSYILGYVGAFLLGIAVCFGFVMYFALKGLSESRLSDNANTDHYSRTRSDKRITYADYYSRNNKKEELS